MQRHCLILFVTLLLLASCAPAGTPTPAGPPTPTPLTVKALADVVLHTGPGSDYAELTRLSKGEPVALLGKQRSAVCSEWVLVRTQDGQEGWTLPVLVNVDIERSQMAVIPRPTPAVSPTPVPSSCNDGMALVAIDNGLSQNLSVFMSGPEPEITFGIEGGASFLTCLAPGEYCFDLTDGERHENGSLSFSAEKCTCWHLGGGQPEPGSCQCPEDPAQYERP